MAGAGRREGGRKEEGGGRREGGRREEGGGKEGGRVLIEYLLLCDRRGRRCPYTWQSPPLKKLTVDW